MQRRRDRAYTRLHPPPKQSSTSEPLERRVDRSNRARPRRACSRSIVRASSVRCIAGVAFSESACVQARSKKKQHRCSCALVMVLKSERTRANCVHVKYCQCSTPTRECLTHHARRGCRDGAPSRQHARPQACFEVRSSTKHMLVIDLLQIVSSRQQTLPRMRLRDLHVGARL